MLESPRNATEVRHFSVGAGTASSGGQGYPSRYGVKSSASRGWIHTDHLADPQGVVRFLFSQCSSHTS